METVALNRNTDLSEDTYMEHSLPLVDSMERDIFGEQVMFPRIGEEYQVELPKLVKKSDYFAKDYQTEVESVGLRFLMGLPIPITLVQQDREDLRQETVESFEMLKNPINVKEPAWSLNRHMTSNGLMSGELSSQYKGQGYFLVPGSASQCLSDFEKGRFLLGLYIFLKNFIQLKRFIESKSMGDIQAYYYGEFYKTHEHIRWSERRKIRTRKCVVGQKLFTGVRLQEFLSRILPVLSDECKHAVLEVSKIYEDGKMAFEEFIFSLKSLVGTSILVEAAGIGKGKHDLTCMVLENTKSSQGISTRPEMPIGKACASLTCNEIIRYLTGDYRLSKARSNDLFWEAVWPRLLARGWRSEQPKDQGYATGSKNNLVFLVPGIKKFSRWKLKRGSQYFDSVSDVLNKVTSEPKLLDLDSEEIEKKKNKEEFERKHEKSEEDDVSTQRRHCYLQPRTPNRGTDGMKLTVVDTSLGGTKPYIIKELSSLSVDVFNGVNTRSPSEMFYEDAPDASIDVSDNDDIVYPETDENFHGLNSLKSSNGEVYFDLDNVENSNSKKVVHEPCVNPEVIHVNDNTESKHCPDSKKPIRAQKNKFHQKMKVDHSENAATCSKRRRRLTPCNAGETSYVVPVTAGPEIARSSMWIPSENPVQLVPEMATCGSSIHELVERAPASDVPYMSSPTESVGYASVGNFQSMLQHQEALRPRPMIDLNFPPVSDTAFTVTEETREPNEKADEPGCSNASYMSNDLNCSEEQSTMNLQRRSTRNRPPTTRALEALANGFLTVNRRGKGKEGSSRSNSTSRPSRRARGGIDLSEYQISDVGPSLQESQSNGSDGNTTEIREYRVLPEETVYQFLPPSL